MSLSPQASPLGRAPVVATVTRSGLVESVHHGIVVATEPDGSIAFSRGPHDVPVYPRSAAKPMQSVAMLRSGLLLDGELLALASASHSGEDFHLEGVRRILALADEGLTEHDLRNTPDDPFGDQARRAWLAAGEGPRSITQNCSGKHAAMLLTCICAGWDTTTYLDPDHRLQRAVAATVEDLAEEKVSAVGVDGCGAPVMAITVTGLARAFGTMAAAPEHTPQGRVATALREHPRWVGGTGRDVSDLIAAVPGLIAKDGAESVYAVGLPDGRGLAVKITDGGARARAVVTIAALKAMGVRAQGDGGEDRLGQIGAEPVLGHGSPVGSVQALELTAGEGR